MPLRDRITVSGLSAVQANAVQGTTADNLTALTGGQGAVALIPADFNFYSTVPSGGGVLVPPMNPSDQIEIFNGGGNGLSIFPPVGGKINGLATNAAYVVSTATPYAVVSCINPLKFIASQSA